MIESLKQRVHTNGVMNAKWSLLAHAIASVGFGLGALWPLQADASQALAQKYACIACHQPKVKVVGPSWQSIRERYGQAKVTAEQLAASIKAGGSGKWGPIAMPAQNQISDADLQSLAQWVLEDPK